MPNCQVILLEGEQPRTALNLQLVRSPVSREPITGRAALVLSKVTDWHQRENTTTKFKSAASQACCHTGRLVAHGGGHHSRMLQRRRGAHDFSGFFLALYASWYACTRLA
jgi:hypothetical protein